MRATIATLLLSLCWACGPAAAEPAIPAASYPALVKHAQSVEGFLPWEWRIELKVSGDLNGDGRDDVVLVLRAIDDRNVIDMRGQGGPESFDTNPRILMVAFANAAGGYDLALENHTLIARTTEPSAQDPLDPNGVQEGGVAIKKGTLQVTLGYFGGNMGHLTHTFRFQGGRFALIGFDSVDVERSKGTIRQVSVNYATRRMERSIGKISDDINKVTRTTLPAKPLLTMEQVGDGLQFNPPSK
jgi:hypothetical protein